MIYVDRVRFMDGSRTQEVQGYLKTEHTDHCFVWLWSDKTLRIPMHSVRDIVTTEEHEE